MSKFYGIKGRCGYVHARCLEEYRAANTRFNAQGRAVSGPMVDSMIDDLGHAVTGKCLHCGKALDGSDNREQMAMSLGYCPTALRQRLQQVRDTLLVDREGFGDGFFYFASGLLIGDNGVILKWQTRRKPDEPISEDNPQTTTGHVAVIEPAPPKTKSKS